MSFSPLGTTAIRAISILALTVVVLACEEGKGRPPGATASFTHGVASGDVTDDRAVFWTRAEGGDTVTLEVATDPTFNDIRVSERFATSAERDYTVKLTADGLDAGTRYYYRFRAGAATSQTGTLVTAPPEDSAQAFSFVFSGDSDGARNPDGSPAYNEFEVLDAAAREDASFFLYFGDAIYGDRAPRAQTVDDFRAKYRQNRAYPALASILAAMSTYNTWDDHEVENDFAGAEVDAALLAAGRQAFEEYLPVTGGEELYRSFRWGRDVELLLLDERSHRDESANDACGGDPLPGLVEPGAPSGIRSVVGLTPELPAACAEVLRNPERTMLGAEQKTWLKQRLAASDATWKVIVNEVPVQELVALPYDRWEGYPAERREILELVRDEGIENVVFLTTDLHATVFGAVRVDAFNAPEPVAYEAVVGPIATTPLRQDIVAATSESAADALEALLDGLLHVDCANLDSFSYGLVEVDPASARMTITSKDQTGRELCRKELQAQ